MTDGCRSQGCLLSLIPCSTRSDARGSDWSALRASWSRLRANKLALGPVHGRVGLGWQDTINNNGKVWQRPLVVTRDTAQRGINGRYARVQKVHLANKMICYFSCFNNYENIHRNALCINIIVNKNNIVGPTIRGIRYKPLVRLKENIKGGSLKKKKDSGDRDICSLFGLNW